MRRWKRLKSEYVLQHPIVRLRKDACQLPRGAVIEDYYVVEEHDVGMVFALTADQHVILWTVQAWYWRDLFELPAVSSTSATATAGRSAELSRRRGFDAPEHVYAGAFVQTPPA
jgi:hypothetical protein